jgi:hypothetical protein
VARSQAFQGFFFWWGYPVPNKRTTPSLSIITLVIPIQSCIKYSVRTINTYKLYNLIAPTILHRTAPISSVTIIPNLQNMTFAFSIAYKIFTFKNSLQQKVGSPRLLKVRRLYKEKKKPLQLFLSLPR